MSLLTDMLLKQLGDGGLSSLSQNLGADQAATKTAAAAALPMLVSALAKNASSSDGASALDQALGRDHDGSALDNLGALLGQGPSKDGEGILKHVLGGKRQVAEAGIAKASGLDVGQAASMLATLAPMLMGALGKAKREKGLDAGGVAGMLAGEGEQAKQALGGLAGFLDQDGDGDIKDDILGGIAKGLGGKLFGK